MRRGGFETFGAFIIRVSFRSLCLEVQFVPIDSHHLPVGGSFSVRTTRAEAIIALLKIHKADLIDRGGKLVLFRIKRRVGANQNVVPEDRIRRQKLRQRHVAFAGRVAKHAVTLAAANGDVVAIDKLLGRRAVKDGDVAGLEMRVMSDLDVVKAVHRQKRSAYISEQIVTDDSDAGTL